LEPKLKGKIEAQKEKTQAELTAIESKARSLKETVKETKRVTAQSKTINK